MIIAVKTPSRTADEQHQLWDEPGGCFGPTGQCKSQIIHFIAAV